MITRYKLQLSISQVARSHQNQLRDILETWISSQNRMGGLPEIQSSEGCHLRKKDGGIAEVEAEPPQLDNGQAEEGHQEQCLMHHFQSVGGCPTQRNIHPRIEVTY